MLRSNICNTDPLLQGGRKGWFLGTGWDKISLSSIFVSGLEFWMVKKKSYDDDFCHAGSLEEELMCLQETNTCLQDIMCIAV